MGLRKVNICFFFSFFETIDFSRKHSPKSEFLRSIKITTLVEKQLRFLAVFFFEITHFIPHRCNKIQKIIK